MPPASSAATPDEPSPVPAATARTTTTLHPMVEAARRLGPGIDDVADDIEREGRLPHDLAQALTDAGVFQMYVPRSVGGAQVSPLVAYDTVHELARHDGSVGWCVQVAAAVSVFLAWLDPEAATEMAASTTGPLHLAGSARPLGTVRSVVGDTGYRLSGRWNFASGVRHANWFLATAMTPGSDGKLRPRSMLTPVESGDIVDTWNVVGMRGTGSDDFALDDVAVPESRVCSRRWIAPWYGTVYDPRLLMVGAWAPTAGVGTGLARGAIDALTALGEQPSTGSPEPLRSRASVQEAVARAVTRTEAARAYVLQTFADAWGLVEGAPPVGADPALDGEIETAAARAQLAITHSLNEAVAVADLCFHAGGTNAISTANRLERILRDAHTAVQHSAGQAIHQRVAGRVLLGLGAGAPDPRLNGPGTPRA